MIDLFLTLMITLFSGDVPTETIHVENQAATTEQMAPVDTKPTIADFKKTVADYLAWEVSNILKNQNDDSTLGK